MKWVVWCALGLVVILGTALAVRADLVTNTTPGLVTWMLTYPEYGNGEVLFKTENMPSACFGYWLVPTAPGFKTTFATVLSAYMSDRKVLVYAYDHVIWSGSTNRYCQVHAATLSR